MRFTTGYMDNAVFELSDVLDEAERVLRPVAHEFDTLVGTGFSGGLVIPALALRLEKGFVLVRKDNDDSHHGEGRLLGNLGERWIFVDDFVSSGRTRRRVEQKIADGALNCWDDRNRRPVTHVGCYYYAPHIERRYQRTATPTATPARVSGLTTVQASALGELRRFKSLRPSSRAFDESTGRRAFSRRTLQALVDAGLADWKLSVRMTRRGPETYNGFITERK